MDEVRESIVFYRSFYEAIRDLDPEDYKECMNAILEYGLNGVEEDVKGIAKAVLTLVKPQIDANNKRRANGAKGGAPAGNSNATKTTKNNQKQPKDENKQPNVNVNVNDNVNDNKKKSKPKEKPESVEEVASYCRERNNSVDPQKWWDYYSSNGWKVGKNTMKDWKACVRTWEKNSFDSRSSPTKINKFNQFPQNTYDFTELEMRLMRN